mgnify:CR=1 FL=1
MPGFRVGVFWVMRGSRLLFSQRGSDAFSSLFFECGFGKVVSGRRLLLGGLPVCLRARLRLRGSLFYVDHDGPATVQFIDHRGTKELIESVAIHLSGMMREDGFADDLDSLRKEKQDPVDGEELSAWYFDEGFDRSVGGVGRCQTFADMRKGSAAGEVDSSVTGSGEVDGIPFQYGYCAMEFPEPADIAMLDDFSERDIDLVQCRLETLHGASSWIAEIFILRDGNKQIDDILRILTGVIDFEYAKQSPERGARDIVALMTEDFYEMLGIASARRLDLGYDADVLMKIVG